MSKIIWIHRDWVGRGRILIILFDGWFGIGLGPFHFIERVWWKKKLVYRKWYSKKTYLTKVFGRD